MNDEVWEFSPNETQRILTVISLLRQTTCPYLARPIVRAYEEADRRGSEKEISGSSPLRLLVSYPSSTHSVTLHQYLQLDHSRRSDVKVSLAYQLARAVDFLHTCGVGHQFLSSDTVVVELEPDPTIKITNFCSCTTSPNCTNSYICVRNYRPPEVVLQLSGIQPRAVDCWALGCLLFEVYTGSAAFSLERADGNFQPQLIKQQLSETVKGIGRLGADDIPPGCPERVSQYLLGLHHDASISARMRVAGPSEEAERWISMVRPLLHFNFNLRSSAKEVLQHELFAGLPPPVNWPTPCEVPARLQELLD
ncbi:protein kinase [Trypanosoma grayi]|uniref:protein kinase n=1 Tax=Trypanosoma grayi TaxID=71804 RepID=UPI0004F4A73F|nr:protein kinase [Trypanosoma grayi]KEG11280.1 protein kinase [Trypanosoma grayi]